MNMKLVILGAIVLIMMVVFGNDPIQEQREERERKRKGLDDPLIEAITEYNKSNPAGRSGGIDMAPRRSSDGTSRDIPAYMMPPNYSQRNTRQQQKIAPATQQPQVPTIQQPAGNPNKTYYPPPPVRDDSARRPGAGITPSQNTPRAEAHMYLRNGQRLAFKGTRVYYQPEPGLLKPLPDGRYRTEDGVELYVQDGRKTIASN